MGDSCPKIQPASWSWWRANQHPCSEMFRQTDNKQVPQRHVNDRYQQRALTRDRKSASSQRALLLGRGQESKDADLRHPFKAKLVVSQFGAIMIKVTHQPSGKHAFKGHFYCAYDTVSRRIRFTIEANSEGEALSSMVRAAPLLGITKDEKFFFVVLDEAPHGVPTFLKWFFALKTTVRSERVQPQFS